MITTVLVTPLALVPDGSWARIRINEPWREKHPEETWLLGVEPWEAYESLDHGESAMVSYWRSGFWP